MRISRVCAVLLSLALLQAASLPLLAEEAQPGVAQPGVAQPGAARPGAARPGAARPDAARQLIDKLNLETAAVAVSSHPR